MGTTEKKGILTVSFGTSVNKTREKTIDAIELYIQKVFPDDILYRAWTSGMIIKKIKKRDDVHIDTVTEAMERMLSDGVTRVVVQPTHVINGVENDRMIADVLAYKERFHKIAFGTPLLTSDADFCAVIEAVMAEFKDLPEEEALKCISWNRRGISVYGDADGAGARLWSQTCDAGTVYGSGRRACSE